MNRRSLIGVSLAALCAALGPAQALLHGSPPTSTVTYTETQLKAITAAVPDGGFFGFFDTTTVAAQRRFTNSGFTNQQLSDWTGYINGSSATLRCRAGGTTPMTISIDDGAWTTPTMISGSASDGVIQLFSNLADTPHIVRIRGAVGQAAPATFTSGTVFSVTGFGPAVSFGSFGPRQMVTDPSLVGISTMALTATPGGNFLPTFSDTQVGYAQNGGQSLKINTNSGSIWVFTGDLYCFYTVDGGSLVQVTLPASGVFGWRAWKLVATGLNTSAAHNYCLAMGTISGARGATLGVMVDSNSTFSAVPATKVLDQYGNSITQGVSDGNISPTCDVDIYQAASTNNALGCPIGLTGATAASMDAALASWLNLRANPVASNHIAVDAIGRNDTANTEGPFKTSLTSCYNQLLSAGYNTIISRGIVMGGAVAGASTVDGWKSDVCVTMQAANPTKVIVFIPTSGSPWTSIPAPRGTHLETAQYIVAAGLEATAYAPYL